MIWEPWSRKNWIDLARYVTPEARRWLPLEVNAFDVEHSPGGRLLLAEAIYSALQQRRIRYALEKYHPSSHLQVILSPAEILGSDRRGTCLDLAALYCGICLGYGLLPVLIVTRGHALAAVSLTNGLHDRDYRPGRGYFEKEPLTEVGSLRDLIDKDYAFVPVECTGFAHSDVLGQGAGQAWPEGQHRDGGVLSFERAVAAGRSQLDCASRPFQFALDIAVAHYDWEVKPYPIHLVMKTHRPEIQRFIEEYRGNVTRRVPFGGRDIELRQLDSWLDDANAHPFLLWVAPAGRGKSALLVEWLKRLEARHDSHLQVVFVPISVRFGTSLETSALPALAYQLAEALGEAPPDPRLVDLSLIADYLRQSPREGQRLLVVIDGLDEASGWELTEAYLPREPDRIRIVLSARDKSNDSEGAAWLRQLGLPPNCIRQLGLLNRSGLEDVLCEMGFPLDQLSERVVIIDELFRLTEGDPLLLRLYVDDLWVRGEEVARLEPRNLQEIVPGYRGYFHRWWEDQRKLWGVQNLASIAEALLNVLAFARGPLGLDEVVELLESERVSSRTIRDRVLPPLNRLVIGDGKILGFSLQHPKLRAYFREDLAEREQQGYEKRFLTWGAKVLVELGAGERLPKNVPGYLVQFLGQHLQDAEISLNEMLPLLDESWQQAWERFDGATHANYLHDIRRVAGLARAINHNAAERDELTPALGTELWCSLIEASICTLSQNVSSELLRAMVRINIWSQLQGLAHARQITNEGIRAESLIALGSVVRKEYMGEVIAEARQIRDVSDRSVALAGIAEYLPIDEREGLLQESLVEAELIDHKVTRWHALLRLVRACPPEQGLGVARQIEDAYFRWRALMMLVDRLPQENQAALLREAFSVARQISYAPSRSRALAGLAERLRAEQREKVLQEALAIAREIEESRVRSDALAELIKHLPVEQQAIVIEEVLGILRQSEHLFGRCDALAFIVEVLPIEKAIDLVGHFADTYVDSHAQASLVKRLPPERALAVARQIKDKRVRSEALANLTDNFQPEQALDVARQIEDAFYRSRALVKIATRMSSERQIAILQEAFVAARRIEDGIFHSTCIVQLAERLPPEQALGLARQINDASSRLKVLAGVVKRSPLESRAVLLREAFDVAGQIDDATDSSHTLAGLIECLPQVQQSELLMHIRDPDWRSAAMKDYSAGLAPEQGLGVARQIERAFYRWQALMGLVERLPQEEQAALLQEAFAVARQIGYGPSRSRALTGLAERLPPDQREVVLLEALAAARQIRHVQSRSAALAGLIRYLAPDQQAVILEEAINLTRQSNDYFGVEAEAELVELLPFELALSVARRIEDAFHGWHALARLYRRSPPEQQAGLLKEALCVARQIKYDFARSRALATLSAYLPAGQQAGILDEALAQTRQLEDSGQRAQILADFLDRWPQEEQLRIVEEAVSALLEKSHGSLHDNAMQSVISMLVTLDIADADRSWARLVQQLPLDSRYTWFKDLEVSLPLIERIGGEQALLELAKSIIDVIRRWP